MSAQSYEAIGDAGAADAGQLDHVPAHGVCPPTGWDYLFVFAAPTALSVRVSLRQRRSDAVRQQLLARLADASFAYSQLWLPGPGLYLVRAALPEAALQENAELLGLPLRLAPRFGGGILPFSRARAECFERFAGHAPGHASTSYFSPAQRLAVTLAVLHSREQWGLRVGLHDLFHDRVLRQAHPLHAAPARDALLRDVVRARTGAWPWSRRRQQLLDRLRGYFGARIALYFAWLLFYARMLCGFAVASTAVHIGAVWLVRDGRRWLADLLRVAYGVSVSFWATYWLEHWGRRNAVLNARWGLAEHPDQAVQDVRQDFQGVDVPGFYSRGGFVHLADLSTSAAAQPETPAEPDLEAARGAPAWTGSAQSSDEEERRRMQKALEFNRVHRENARQRAIKENPSAMVDGQEYVVIGSERDADFRVLAPVTGAKFDTVPQFPFFSPGEHRRRRLVTTATTVLFITVISALQFGITYFKNDFSAALGFQRNEAWPAGLVTGIIIVIADSVWKTVSTNLVKWENHHANQSFENSLIRKRFAFQFVSNYFSLFYVAFVKPFTPSDPCSFNSDGNQDCMNELGTTLLSIVATKATMEQFIDFALPYLTYVKNSTIHKASTKKLRFLLSLRRGREHERLLENGALLENDNDTHGDSSVSESKRGEYENTVEEFARMVIMHGFIALFGMACPLIVPIVLVSTLLEFRLDVYKMLRVYRRPTPDYATDIGEWINMLRALSTLSVITMVGMTAITAHSVQILGPGGFGWITSDRAVISFLIFEHVLLFVRWVVANLINEIPGSTYRLRARREFLISKFFNIGWKPHFRSSH